MMRALILSLALAGCVGEPPGRVLPPEAPAYAHAGGLRRDWGTRGDLPPCERSWGALEVRHVPGDEWGDTLGGCPCGVCPRPCTLGLAVRWGGVPMIFVADAEPPIHVVRHEMAHLLAACAGIRDPDHERPEIWNQPHGVVWAYEDGTQWD